MSNLDDYRGRLLARAFYDELEKMASPYQSNAAAALKPPVTPSKPKVTPPGKIPTTGSFAPKPLKIPSTNMATNTSSALSAGAQKVTSNVGK